MLAAERRNQILDKLQEEKKVVVSELSRLYNVSEETIRRDLEKLEKEGYATKSYGGAVLNENVGFDMPLNIRSKKNVDAKQTIARLAAQEIHDGDHILLDASSTDLFIAKAIKDKHNLTVVTNSIEIILELSEISGFSIISTGGTLKQNYLALLGPWAEESVRNFFVDRAFVSCKGLDQKLGIFDSLEQFSTLKRQFIKSSAKSYLTLDHTKFGRTAFSRTGSLDEISTVITDEKPDQEWIDLFQHRNIELIYPGSERREDDGDKTSS